MTKHPSVRTREKFTGFEEKTLKRSLRGVVENLEETPSSQVRAFWRQTSGAADTKSVPTATEA